MRIVLTSLVQARESGDSSINFLIFSYLEDLGHYEKVYKSLRLGEKLEGKCTNPRDFGEQRAAFRLILIFPVIPLLHNNEMDKFSNHFPRSLHNLPKNRLSS